MFLYKYQKISDYSTEHVYVTQEAEQVETVPEPTETAVKKQKREEHEKGCMYVFLNPMYAYYGENVYVQESTSTQPKCTQSIGHVSFICEPRILQVYRTNHTRNCRVPRKQNVMICLLSTYLPTYLYVPSIKPPLKKNNNTNNFEIFFLKNFKCQT